MAQFKAKFVVHYPNDGNEAIIYGPFKSYEVAKHWKEWMDGLDQLHNSSGESDMEARIIELMPPIKSIPYEEPSL